MTLRIGFALRQNEFNSPFECDRKGILVFGDRDIFPIMLHVRAEATGTHRDRQVFEGAEFAREFAKFERLLERDGRDALIGGQTRETRFVVALSAADLHHRTETPDFHTHRFARRGVGAEMAFAHARVAALREHGLHLGFQVAVECADQFGPILFALGHQVEIVFHVRREIVVHDFGELLHEEVVDHNTRVGGNELTAIAAVVLTTLLGDDVLARERDQSHRTRLTFVLSPTHVFALLNG